MMPTTTDSRNKRLIDESMCLSFLRKPCREEETSKHGQISQSWFVRFIRSLASPSCKRWATLVITERDSMDSAAQVAVSSNNTLRLVDCMSMPDSVYPLIWSFLLDSDSETGSSFDFKSIMSFMLVNKTSKDAFDNCRGWWLCAQALKQEAEAKELLTNRFVFRSTTILYSMRLLRMNCGKFLATVMRLGKHMKWILAFF
jgi:hypothetical protein